MTIQNASAVIESIAHYYGNGNEKRETADRWVTCCPIHGDHNPSLALEIDPRKQHGFAFVCRSRNCDGKTILSRFVADGLIQPNNRRLKKEDRGSLIIPIPLTAPLPPSIQSGSTRYRYLNKLGQTLIYVDRIPKDNGGKDFFALCLYTNKNNPTELGWAYGFPKGFKDKPLYGLERFAHDTPFLLCEGEKKVDRAAVIFGSSFVPISYQGGVNAFEGTDWSEVPKESKIVIWPDNDDAAKQTIMKNNGLADFLISKGYIVTIVPVWEYNLPPKWDLADPLPEGWDLDRLQELVAEAKPLLYFRKTALNELCKLSETIGNAALNYSCKTTTESVCEFCHFKGRFESPNEFLGLDRLHQNIIMITEQGRYYDVACASTLTADGISMSYSCEPGYAATGRDQPHVILKDSNIVTRAHNFISWPGRGLLIRKDGKQYLNTWRPWAIREFSNVRPQLWLDLAAHIFPDPDIRELVINWLSHTIKYPLVKINYGLLIISPIQGIGKSLFVEGVKRLLGQSARSIDMTTFGTQYTSYLEGLKLLIIEELAATGQLKANYNKLKTMVAAPPEELEINEKYIKSYNIPNLINVIAFTNKEVPIIMEEYDRRWLVYRSEVRPKQYDFYNDYVRFINSNEGLDSLYWFLINRDLSQFDVGRAPAMTEAKRELINMSREPIIADLIDQDLQCAYPFNSHLTTEKDVIDYVYHQLRQQISGVKARQYLKSMGYMRIAQMQINSPGKTVDQRTVWSKSEYADFFISLAKSPTTLAKHYLRKDRSTFPAMSLI